MTAISAPESRAVRLWRWLAAAPRRMLAWGRHHGPAITYHTLAWGRYRVPVGVRSVIGVVIMLGGVFGFLPLLGFWMIPLGAAFVALDIPWTRHRIHDWMETLRARVARHSHRTGGPD